MARLQMVLLALLAAMSLPAFASAESPEVRPNYTDWKAAKAKESEKAANITADKAKRAAVDKVVFMLDDLKNKVLIEGNEEAKTYNKFACFCKDALAEKKSAISEGTNMKESLTSKINELAGLRTAADTRIKELEQEIQTLEGDLDSAGQTNTEAVKKFNKEQAELTKAIRALENAIKVTKASRPASLLQLQSIVPTLRWAASMAEALGELDKRPSVSSAAAALLQQAPDVEMENYKFHSEGVIDMLENLLTTFRTKLTDKEDTETKRMFNYDKLVLVKTNAIKAANREVEQKTQEKAEYVSEIGAKSERLTTVASTLLDDKSYEMELHTMCKKKGEVWTQRSQARSDELSALTSAVAIIRMVKEKVSSSTVRLAQQGARVRLAAAMSHSEEAMEADEADAESAEASPVAAAAAPTFLQKLSRKHSVEPHVVLPQALVDLLTSKGKQLKSSALTALASQLSSVSTGTTSGDPFQKVKQLIEALILRLQTQASDEATWKSTCDKEYSTEFGNRDNAVAEIRKENDALADLEATIDTLTEEINTLVEEITALEKQMAETSMMRSIEKNEHETAIKEAEDGLSALNTAIKILSDYYGAAAANKVTYALLQQDPAKDAPDADFAEDYGAYKGDQETSTSVMGMLEVIKTDFNRTIEETKADEAAAVKEFEKFETDNKEAQRVKNEAKGSKTTEKDTASSSHTTKTSNLLSQNTILKNAIKAIIQLNWTCRRKETGETYAERVARRDEEIAALHKALCILSNYGSYAGPGLTSYDVCE